MSLHYGDPQMAIGAVFAALALLLAMAFLVIGAQAGSDVAFERVHRVGYWLRKRWLALLLVIGVLPSSTGPPAAASGLARSATAGFYGPPEARRPDPRQGPAAEGRPVSRRPLRGRSGAAMIGR